MGARVIVRHASLTGFRAYRARSVFFIFAMSRLWWSAVKDSRLAGRSRRKAAAAELRRLRFLCFVGLHAAVRPHSYQNSSALLFLAALLSSHQPLHLPSMLYR